MPEATIIAESAMDTNGNLTIKNYADTVLVLPFFDTADNPRDMTGVPVRLIAQGLDPIIAQDTDFPHVKRLVIPADYAEGFEENRPKEYAIVEGNSEVISGAIRARIIT